MAAVLLGFRDLRDLLGFKEDRAHKVPPVAAALLAFKDPKGQPEPKDQLDQPGALVQLAFSAQLPLRWESIQQQDQLEH